MLVSSISNTAVTVQIRQRSGSGYGDYWDAAGNAWTASQPAALALVQDGDEDDLWVKVLALATYSGKVEIFYYSGGQLQDSTIVNLADGVPTDAVTLASGSEGGVATDLSLVEVSPQRTWSLRPCATGMTAAKVVSMLAGANEVLAFDFSEALDANDSIDDVSSVVEIAANATVSDSKVSGNRREIHFRATGFNSGQQSTLQVTVTTAQGQTLVGRGVVAVE